MWLAESIADIEDGGFVSAGSGGEADGGEDFRKTGTKWELSSLRRLIDFGIDA